MTKLHDWLKLLRVKHYIKNLLLFVPLFFSRHISWPQVTVAFLGFLAFCCVASTVYLINDISDVEKDRAHPTKCRRPLAKGSISASAATVAAVLLTIVGLALSLSLNVSAALLLVTYIVINLLYSKGLKNVPLLDITILALGYLLRVYYGALLFGIPVSSLLYLTILSAAFFMGLGKRKGELKKVQNASSRRKVLQFYTAEFLDKNLYMLLGLTIVFYSMWCMDSVQLAPHLLATVPIVMLICMRYSLLIESTSDGDPINVLFSDVSLVLFSILFVAAITYLLYF